MSFTIKIDEVSPKAKSIITMLKELAEDYSFIEIIDEGQSISENVVQELEARYNKMIEHPDNSESWEKVKRELLSD